ncbi:hypothetical protein BDY19DRAFT_999517 [Irpex rosettiformis]|uniref:Uncharacterized protein n=1 Tax=Irpex rosettiformis TaxID=378272 RepID=A0ACB8UJH2_9APHY|nr:hypothetical protein BDY19DRAFT_999517 [Irpex rosettiformis]
MPSERFEEHSPSRASLAHLPTELYNAIVTCLKQDANDHHEFTRSLLALSRAIPRSPLPLDLLLRCIILRTPVQAQRLFIRLFKDPALAQLVEVFKYECFEADADIIVNLLKMLQSITTLTLFMGPNFAPEHLEEIFASPRTNLKSLSLRFRPYVKKASYLQFMKGVYFDSTLSYLSKWPRSSLPKLSIIQDPLDASIAPEKKFAQPIVFFRLDPISILSTSSFASSLTSLRFRIPFRHIVPHLHKYQQSLPEVQFLDIATCSITESELEGLLVDSKGIHTLILDGCPIVSQRGDALDVAEAQALEQWTSLGKTLALVGVKRAHEREKKIKKWIEKQESAVVSGKSNEGESRKAKRGRKGIANATFMIRDAAREETNTIQVPSVLSVSTSLKGKERANKPSPSGPKLGESSNEKSKAAVPLTRSSKKKKPQASNFRIAPSPSAIRSLSITAPMVSVKRNDFKERYSVVKSAFGAGWVSGVRQLKMTRDRMRTTWHTGVTRVLIDATYRHPTSERNKDSSSLCDNDSDLGDTSWDSDSYSSNVASEELDRRLEFKEQLKRFMMGLKDAASADVFDLDLDDLDCPVLCLAGPDRGGWHPDGCPHVTAWKLWDDEL